MTTAIIGTGGIGSAIAHHLASGATRSASIRKATSYVSCRKGTAGFEPVKAGGIEQSSRLEVAGDLHDLVVGVAEARSRVGGT